MGVLCWVLALLLKPPGDLGCSSFQGNCSGVVNLVLIVAPIVCVGSVLVLTL